MIRRALRSLLLVAFLLGWPAGPATAQSGALQSPADFLGYELGTQFTPHHRVMDYVRHVAGQSPNVELQPYGTTYEGRPLLVAFVSSPENLQRLETIRMNNLRLAGMAEGAVQEPTRGIVWLSYNVHGNESVSTEAAMQTLYELADPSNARTQPWLDDLVVAIDPCINPDGRERYVQWYNRTVGRVRNPTPEAREHDEPWPGGRTNHYYFDLNRDWAWGVQKETQQRLPLYNRWMPHIHVDFHEQGVNDPYYFAPAAQPFHENITEWQREFQYTIGRNHAEYFDRNNWLYFTREVFDLFYPGYGDTWPIFNGAIGMTYEQGGSGRAGLAIETAEGDTLTLRDRMIHHHTTGLSTVEVAAQNSERMVDEFEQYYTAAQNDPPGEYDTYVIKRGGHDDRMAALAEHLDEQGIQYGYAAESQTAEGVNYANGQMGDAPIAAGDMIVSAYQPKSRLAKVLFEPKPTLTDSLTYDITAWALPYAYGLNAYAVPERLTPGTDAAPSQSPSEGDGGSSPYAYLVEWQSVQDLEFVAALLQEDIKLRFAAEPFTINEREYGRGTLILTRVGNEHMGARFDRLIRSTAQTMNQPLQPVQTGFVAEGPNFGSDNVPFLERPDVAVLAGEGLSSYAVGEVWHYFDQQIRYPATLVSADELDVQTLYDYDVLVMPSGRYSSILDDGTLEALQDWIRDGGRLIAVGEGAVSALAGKEGFALKQKEDAEEGDDAEEDAGDAPEPQTTDYSQRQREYATEATPGSIHRVQLDTTHPLGFGVGAAYYTLKRSDDAYALLEDDWNVGVLRQGQPVSGFMGSEVQQKIDDTLAFGVQEMGSGTVVYLVDNPLFRGFWYSGKLLFGNAVFLAGQG